MFTKDQNLALQAVRKAMYQRLKNNFCFTEEMLSTLSIFQLVNLLMLVAGDRNYLGQFSYTIYTLQDIFGVDAVWDKPVIEKKNRRCRADGA